MKTETRALYAIEELGEAAKSRAIERHRHFCVQGDWFDYVMDDFVAVAAAIGFTIDRHSGVSFSGFYCQGDGASFRGRYDYSPGWRAALEAYCPTESEVFSIGSTLEAISGEAASAAITTSGRSSHEGSMAAECWTADGDDSSNAATVIFLEAARRLAKWLYRRLEQEYESVTGDEYVAESLLANELWFTANGDDA